jgi:hypothetical protein
MRLARLPISFNEPERDVRESPVCGWSPNLVKTRYSGWLKVCKANGWDPLTGKHDEQAGVA